MSDLDAVSNTHAQRLERLRAIQETMKEEMDRHTRYMPRVRELYKGLLPFRLASKWETRAYWQARLQAWDELFLFSEYTTPETVKVRNQMGRMFGA